MLSISLDKESYAAGETVAAAITLGLKKPLRARGLYAEVVCIERHRVTEQRVMDKYDYDREKELGGFKETHLQAVTTEHESVLFREEKTLAGEGTFSAGEYSVSFTLPASGPPTSREFGHDNKTHIWKIFAKLDIPFALDQNAEKEIFVEGL